MTDHYVLRWTKENLPFWQGVDSGDKVEIHDVAKYINAAEQLSAVVARRNGAILLLEAESLSYGEQTQGYADGNALMAYAKARGGE